MWCHNPFILPNNNLQMKEIIQFTAFLFGIKKKSLLGKFTVLCEGIIITK